MLIRIDQINEKECPIKEKDGTPVPCSGPDCAVWRWADVRKVSGFCGLGCPPLEVDHG